MTVPALLRERARQRPSHALLICDDDRISYAACEDRSARVATALVALGVGKGTHVGLLFPNGSAFVVGMLAAARIGAVVVPFSTFSTARELAWQLADSDVAVLLAAESHRGHDYRSRLSEILGSALLDEVFSTAAPCLRHVLFTCDAPADPALLESLEADVDGCDPLAVIYTSGSSGTPKGVIHTHESLLAHQHNLNEIRGLSADDKLFCNSPFFWIGGFAFAILATLDAGATLLCSNAADAGEVLDLLEAEKPNVTNGFAATVAALTRHPSFADRDLSALRRGNLYPIMAPDVRPADPELRHHMLGMTEAGSVTLLSGDDTDQPERRRGSFGRPAPGFETRVVDVDSGHAADEGELWLRGPYLMQRYHRRSREECFDPDGWFHTGDLVRVDDEGFFYFVGRLGAMIKTAGANVAPAEVEKAITKATGWTSHVLGIADAVRGQAVAAVVAVPPGEAFDEVSVRVALKSELSAYKIPARFAAVAPADIPVLSSGKVDVAALRGLFDG